MFIAEYSPSDWFLDRMHSFSEGKHPVAARVMSLFLGTPISMVSAVFNAGCCIGKLPFSAVYLGVRCLPFAGKKWARQLPKGFTPKNVFMHAYKAAGFVLAMGFSPVLGVASPHFNLKCHRKIRLVNIEVVKAPINTVSAFHDKLSDLIEKQAEQIAAPIPSPFKPPVEPPVKAQEPKKVIRQRNENKSFIPMEESPPEITPCTSDGIFSFISKLFYNPLTEAQIDPRNKGKEKISARKNEISWPKHILEYTLPSLTSSSDESPRGIQKNLVLEGITKEIEKKQELTKRIQNLHDIRKIYEKYNELLREWNEIQKDVPNLNPQIEISAVPEQEILPEGEFAAPPPPPPPPPPTIKKKIPQDEPIEHVELDPIYKKSGKHMKIRVQLENSQKELFTLLWGKEHRKEAAGDDLDWYVKRFIFESERLIAGLQKKNIDRKNVVKKRSSKDVIDINRLPKLQREAIKEIKKAIDLVKAGNKSIGQVEKRLNESQIKLNRHNHAINELNKKYRHNLNQPINVVKEMYEELVRLQSERNKERLLIADSKNNIEKIKSELAWAVKTLQFHAKIEIEDSVRLIAAGNRKIESLKIEGIKILKDSQNKRALVQRNRDKTASPALFNMPKLNPVDSLYEQEDPTTKLINEFYAEKVYAIEKSRIPAGEIQALREEIAYLENQLDSQNGLEDKKRRLHQVEEAEILYKQIGTKAFHERWEQDALNYAHAKRSS